MTPKILLAVKTCHAFRDRALCQRQSWASEVQGADVRFFLGGGEALVGDEVILDCDDGYAGLPAKTQAICKWAVENGYDFACLLDDDTYLRPERLLSAGFEAHDYVGRVRGPSGIFPAPYCSGFAYWLSARAMKVVAEATLNGDDAEDRFVANVLLGANIHPVHDARLRIMNSVNNAICINEPPRRGNNLIAVCEFIGQPMHQVHEQWNANLPSQLKRYHFPEGPLSSVAVLVKTFLRDGLLFRCLDGLEQFYPECKIVLVDDGYGTKQKNTLYADLRDRGHACVWLPFDSGFGAKANAALAFCDRPYVLIGSDDFNFSPVAVRKGIEDMVKVLDHDPTIHIVSGRVNGNPYEALLEMGDDWVREVVGHKETRTLQDVTYKVTDLTVNFSLIRRECLGPRRLHWDGGEAKIGNGEHGAFFIDAKKLGYGVAVIEDAHIHEMYSPEDVHPKYGDYRRRARQPERLCFKARGIKQWWLQGGGLEVTP